MALTQVIGSGIGSSASLVDGNMPAGTVLQVVQDFESASSSESLATGAFSAAILSAAITPSSTSSKILILCTLHLTTQNQTAGAAALLKRGSTAICLGDASGNMARGSGGGLGGNISARLISNIQMTFLDSPSSTSATTYTAHGKTGYNNTQILYWNRELDTTNSTAVTRVPSTLTLMEIAG